MLHVANSIEVSVHCYSCLCSSALNIVMGYVVSSCVTSTESGGYVVYVFLLHSTESDSTAHMLQVTFLYKLTNGACPKSYGVNVARLAGLPASVLACAARTAAAHEAANQGTAPDIQDDNTRKLLVQLSKHSCSEQMYGELRSMWELAQTIALPQVRECSSLIPKQ